MKSVGGVETTLLHKLTSFTKHDSAGVAVGVAVGLGCAQYLPPVFRKKWAEIIKSTPDNHFTAAPDCRVIGSTFGALKPAVAVQLSVPGLYLPPVLNCFCMLVPPQTIMSLPVHTAV